MSLVRILLLSVALGAACWGAMLLLVMFLSRRAVRPVAESMEKQKQFVTNAGHEIKTPLAIIQSNTEAMELYNGENKWSRNIKEQTVRLSGLMQNLLLLARMDEGASQVQAADFSLSDMLTAALESFAQPMEAKHISLEADVKPGVTLHADARTGGAAALHPPGQCREVYERGRSIWIRLQKEDKKIRLSVQNTCETLPDTPPEKLFDRFYREILPGPREVAGTASDLQWLAPLLRPTVAPFRLTTCPRTASASQPNSEYLYKKEGTAKNRGAFFKLYLRLARYTCTANQRGGRLWTFATSGSMRSARGICWPFGPGCGQ